MSGLSRRSIFRPDGRQLIVAATPIQGPLELRLYRTDSIAGPPIVRKLGDKASDVLHVLDVGFFPNGQDIAVTYHLSPPTKPSDRVAVWKSAAQGGPLVPVLEPSKDLRRPAEQTRTLAFSRDGSRWLAGRTVLDGRTFEPVASLPSDGPAALSPDGKRAYVVIPLTDGSEVMGQVGIFDIERRSLISKHRPRGAAVRFCCIDVTHDGTAYAWNSLTINRGRYSALLYQVGERLAAGFPGTSAISHSAPLRGRSLLASRAAFMSCRSTVGTSACSVAGHLLAGSS